MQKMLKSSLLAGVAVALCSVASVQADSIFIDPALSGTVATAEWASGSLAYGSNGSPTSATPDINATLNPIAPGYRASAGFYSFSANFGATFAAQTDFEVKSIVIQLVMMQNTDYTLSEIINFNGGPILSYEIDGVTKTLAATYQSIVNAELNATVGGFTGDFYAFAWQWDLSGVTDVITDFTISAPIIVHSATIEGRLDVSDTFTQVIPEPSHYAVAFGAIIGGIALIRRRKQRVA